jgi:hypothetical protein
MRHVLFLISSIAAAGFSSLPAQAQWANYGDDDSIIRCESIDGRARHCATYGGDAQLVRQLSRSACIRGRTWGTDSRGIWVNSGCRAEFQINSGYGYDDYGNDYGYGYGYGGNDGVFRCESRSGRTERCSTSGGYAQLVRQLSNSPCIRGQSWGNDSRGVWVTDGCRAVFRLDDRYGNGYGYGNGYNNGYGYGNHYGGHYGGNLVRCESRDNRSKSCALSVGRNQYVRLLRQLSKSPCIENQSWGQSRNGVWVTRGCRAEFVVARGNSSGGSQRPPGIPPGANFDNNSNPSTLRSDGPVNPRPPGLGAQDASGPRVEDIRAAERQSERRPQYQPEYQPERQPEQERPARRNPRIITTRAERTDEAAQPAAQPAVQPAAQPGVFQEVPAAEPSREAERPSERQEPVEERRQTPSR